jgi:hypothetical protein
MGSSTETQGPTYKTSWCAGRSGLRTAEKISATVDRLREAGPVLLSYRVMRLQIIVDALPVLVKKC